VAALALGTTVGAVGAAKGLSVSKKPVAFDVTSMTKMIDDTKTMSELYLVGAKLLVTLIENRELTSFAQIQKTISTALNSRRNTLFIERGSDDPPEYFEILRIIGLIDQLNNFKKLKLV